MSDEINENTELQNEPSKEVALGTQFSIKDFQSYYYQFNAKPDRD